MPENNPLAELVQASVAQLPEFKRAVVIWDQIPTERRWAVVVHLAAILIGSGELPEEKARSPYGNFVDLLEVRLMGQGGDPFGFETGMARRPSKILKDLPGVFLA